MGSSAESILVFILMKKMKSLFVCFSKLFLCTYLRETLADK